MTGIHLVIVFACVGYFAFHRHDALTAVLGASITSAVLILVARLTGTEPGGPVHF